MSVEVVQSLIKRGKYINDEAIDGFFALLDKRQILNDTYEDKDLFFSSLFITSLLQILPNNSPSESNYADKFKFDIVKNWYSWHGNIFEKSKIFIPINISNQHWAMVVVYIQEKRIQYYDSLHWNYGKVYVSIVLKYLEHKWLQLCMINPFDKNSWNLVFSTENVPTQGVGTANCKIYVCLLAERITSRNNYADMISQILDENDRARWFMTYCLAKDKIIY